MTAKKFMSYLFFKDFAKIESCFFSHSGNSGTAVFKEQFSFLNKNSNAFEIKN